MACEARTRNLRSHNPMVMVTRRFSRTRVRTGFQSAATLAKPAFLAEDRDAACLPSCVPAVHVNVLGGDIDLPLGDVAVHRSEKPADSDQALHSAEILSGGPVLERP